MGIDRPSARHSVSSYLLITRAVAVSPGAMAFTRTPCGAISVASDFVNAMIAAFEAAYAVRPVPPVMPKFDEVLMITPDLRSRIGLHTAWQHRKVALRL